MSTNRQRIAANRLWQRCLVVAVAAVSYGATLGLDVGGATAASNGMWSVSPTTLPGHAPRAYVEPVLTPGKPYTDAVTVANYTEAPLTFHLYGADAINTPGDGLSLRRRTDVQSDIGKWITLPYSQLTVPARAATIVPFTILPPPEASPGDHVGGIVAEETLGSRSRAGSVPITVIQAVGVRVYGRVIGALQPGLAVPNMSLAATTSTASQLIGTIDARVSFIVQNSGNAVLSPVARVVLTTPFGTAAQRRITIDDLLPRSSLHYTLQFPGVATFGHLRAHVTVTDARAYASATASLWALPWGIFVIVLVVVVLLIAHIIRLRRRRRRAAAQPDRIPAELPS